MRRMIIGLAAALMMLTCLVPVYGYGGNNKLLGDVNYDGYVEMTDFFVASKSLGKARNDSWGYGQGQYNPECDLNFDRVVDLLDFTIISNQFGKSSDWYSPMFDWSNADYLDGGWNYWAKHYWIDEGWFSWRHGDDWIGFKNGTWEVRTRLDYPPTVSWPAITEVGMFQGEQINDLAEASQSWSDTYGSNGTIEFCAGGKIIELLVYGILPRHATLGYIFYVNIFNERLDKSVDAMTSVIMRYVGTKDWEIGDKEIHSSCVYAFQETSEYLRLDWWKQNVTGVTLESNITINDVVDDLAELAAEEWSSYEWLTYYDTDWEFEGFCVGMTGIYWTGVYWQIYAYVHVDAP